MAITSVGKVNATCAGRNNGSFTITTSGANGAVEYSITGGATWQLGNSFSNLAPGNYTVQVRDAAGCNVAATGNPQTITAAQVLSLGFTTTAVTTVGGSNGAVDLNVTGGTTPRTFQWSTGASTEDITNVAANTYCVTVTDANGCINSGCAVVSAPTCSLAVTSVTTTPGCGSNGRIVVSTSGSSGAVEVSVDGGTNWQNSNTVNGLAAGSYTVQVRDAAGCTANAPANPYVLAQPTAIGLSFSTTNVSTTGGSNGAINLTATNATAPVTFIWSNSTSTEDLTGLAAGQYCVTVTGGNGCTATACENVTQPGCNLSASTTVVNVSTSGGSNGSVTLTVNGGTAPFSYSWDNGPTSKDLSNLAAGTYCVTVTDGNNCTANTCATVTQPVNPCNGFTISNVVTSQPTCPGDNGTITISVSGGQNPVLYSVDSGLVFQNGVSLFTVTGGTYNIIVRDNNNCEVVYSNNPVVIATPQGLNPQVSIHGDTIKVNDIGVSYQWLFGGNIIANADDTSYHVIANGDYSVVVTDANGCEYTSNVVSLTGVGMGEIPSAQWQLWPNPTENMLRYSINTADQARFEIWSSDGRLVLASNVQLLEGEIDMSQLAGGVYNIRLITAQGQAVKRIVKY